MKVNKLIISFSIIVIVSTVAFLITRSSEKVSASESGYSVPVKVADIEYRHISPTIITSGRIQTKTESKLSFKIGGIIANIYVEEGQYVEKGRMLARLDQAEISAKVAQARNAHEKAERDLRRIRELYADSVATLEQKQDATTAYEIAGANLRIAEFNLKHSAIHAPKSGKILMRLAEENELISAGTPVFIFGVTGKEWILKVGISDRDIIRVNQGDSASICFDAYPADSISANVSELASTVNPGTGLFELELKFNPGHLKLISGFIGKVAIFPSQSQKLPVIPVEALVEADGLNAYIFSIGVEDNIARKVPVTIRYILEKEIVLNHLDSEISQIATNGSLYLQDGNRVKIINSEFN